MVLALQQPCAREIDQQPGDGDTDCLGKADLHRMGKAQHALPGHQQRDQRKDDGAREAGQIAELAGAEGEARIARLAAGIEVGDCRYQHGARMRRHVPAVGDERHGAVVGPRRDFRHHHRGCQRDHQPYPTRIAIVIGPEEHVVVVQSFGLRAHGTLLLSNASADVGSQHF
jgi:hypothetical protein